MKQSNTTTSNERNIVISYKNVNHNQISYQYSSLLINILFLACPYGLQTRQISGHMENSTVGNLLKSLVNILQVVKFSTKMYHVF